MNEYEYWQNQNDILSIVESHWPLPRPGAARNCPAWRGAPFSVSWLPISCKPKFQDPGFKNNHCLKPKHQLCQYSTSLQLKVWRFEIWVEGWQQTNSRLWKGYRILSRISDIFRTGSGSEAQLHHSCRQPGPILWDLQGGDCGGGGGGAHNVFVAQLVVFRFWWFT